MQPEVEIVLPVYNEGENIEKALMGIHSEVKTPYSIVLIYDFDEDTTLPVAKRVASQMNLPLSFKKNPAGKGVVNALKHGLKSSSAPFVCVMMADLSDPPGVVDQMLAKAKAEDLQLVCASRYMKGGKQIGGPLLKRTLSRMAGLSLCWLARVPTHDATNNFKLYRKDFIEQVEIESQGGFELGLELTVKAFLSGRALSEVPTTWTDREAGESRFNLKKWLPLYLKWYLAAFRA